MNIKARNANGPSSGPPWEAYEIDLRLICVLHVGHGSALSVNVNVTQSGSTTTRTSARTR